VFGAATNMANMAAAKSAASNLVDSAKNGGFTVTKESADELINTLSKFVTEIRDMEPTLAAFDQQPALGGHAYGQLVARHMHEGANGPQSARAVLKQLETILEMSIEALQRASNQYEETEANTVDALNKTSRSI
jgi:SOS response regulatory protein OraA/RecX